MAPHSRDLPASPKAICISFLTLRHLPLCLDRRVRRWQLEQVPSPTRSMRMTSSPVLSAMCVLPMASALMAIRVQPSWMLCNWRNPWDIPFSWPLNWNFSCCKWTIRRQPHYHMTVEDTLISRPTWPLPCGVRWCKRCSKCISLSSRAITK